MLVGGIKRGKKNRSVKNKVKRGGCGSCVLSPASLTDDVSTLPASQMYSNSAKMPNAFSSNQVGGSYGYADTKDVFGGSYATPSTMCTGANIDPSRGGNNFMSGGSFKRQNAMKRRGGGRKTKRSGSKRSGSKRSGSKKGGSKRSGSKRKGGSKRRKGGSKKWRQKGCNKKSGGMILL